MFVRDMASIILDGEDEVISMDCGGWNVGYLTNPLIQYHVLFNRNALIRSSLTR